jgi:crotonobetainyl-CoA:carnitine CoA-transferase CaiB-like acyl-CoA transferase
MKEETMLEGYRVLDLTEGGYQLGGQILGDLGADVIRIEPLGGCPSRNRGPFYKDDPHPEKSLFWFAYNRNKRGVTLNIETEDGREIFKNLVKTADIVMESYSPGRMERFGLGYNALAAIKPDIILTSISSYGQTGPKSHYKTSDLTTWASGLIHSITGDPDRPPVWLSWPSAGLMGGVLGAIGSLFALWHREMTGEGQHVDAPVQQYLLHFTTGAHWFYECMQFSLPRMGRFMTSGFTKSASIRPCKDGYVHLVVGWGAAAGFSDSTARLVKWMDEEGMAPDWLKEMDWFSLGSKVSQMTQEEMDRIQAPFDAFLMTKTTLEISEETAKRGIMGCPVSNSRDICNDHHLEARNFWQNVSHPELGESLTYCGPFVQLSEAAMTVRRRAPLIGEHNREIYEKELGIGREALILLKQAGVV